MSTCPTCSNEGVPALFGLPIDAARAAGEAGDLALMGCFEPEEPVHYRCASGHTWHVEDESRWQADLVAALQKHGYEAEGDEV